MTKTPPTMPIDTASRYRPSSFICFNCAATQADLFATTGSLKNPTEIVPLCFQCYVYKRKWKWRIVKEKRGNSTSYYTLVVIGAIGVTVALVITLSDIRRQRQEFRSKKESSTLQAVLAGYQILRNCNTRRWLKRYR